KRGATAQSLRVLLRALGTKNDARYNLKIVDSDRPEGGQDQMEAGANEDNNSTGYGGHYENQQPVENSPEAPVETPAPTAPADKNPIDQYDDIDV
ncbi:MAG TPA: hypothetical protein VNG90_05205, partial [Candidatus Acidoferrum sp.]|nr:hypothetical protein [Candidatus Acidoferrum sp.]